MLINTTAELKNVLGGAITASDEATRILPYVDLAQDKYIVKAIGIEMFEELDLQNKSEQTLSEDNKILLTKVVRSLAFYAYYEYLSYALGTDGDAGIQETHTKTTRPGRMELVFERKNNSSENAAWAIENTMQFLFANKGKYPTWAASTTYKSSFDLFVNSGTALGEYLLPSGGSYRLFTTLKPYLTEVQRDAITMTLGKEFVVDLITKSRANSLSDIEKELLPYIGRAQSYAAYLDALYSLVIVQMNDGGIRVLSEFDGINNHKSVDSNQLELLRKGISAKKDKYFAELTAFLMAHTVDFPLYVTGGAYKPNRNQPAFMKAGNYKKIFPMR